MPSLWLQAGLRCIMLDCTLVSPSISSLGEEDTCCVVTVCPACGFVLFVICHQKQLVGKIILGTTPNLPTYGHIGVPQPKSANQYLPPATALESLTWQSFLNR